MKTGNAIQQSHPGFDVTIRDNLTQESRVYHDDYVTEEGDFNFYQWSDGNYGCDCNRQRFFESAGGETMTQDPVCGHSRFTVTRVVVHSPVIWQDEDR